MIRGLNLIQQIREGNDAAFDRLVQEWYPRIYNFAWKYFVGKGVGEVHDCAEEIAQKTFIKVYQRIGQLKDDSKFRSWLYRIAANYCFEEDRNSKRRPKLSLNRAWENGEIDELEVKLEDGTPGPAGQLEQMEAADWVLKALKKLPQEQRIVLVMKEYEGLKFKEIASALNISENTAKSRLYYGLKAMRKTLERWQINKETIQYEL